MRSPWSTAVFCLVLVTLCACGSSSGGSTPVTVLSHDIDGDGVRDIIVGAYASGPSTQGEVHVFFGPNYASVADLVIVAA